jgi:hypothetical protein
MTHSFLIGAGSLVAPLCFFLWAGATTAAAQIDCSQRLPYSVGTPPVNQQHIFCGEIKDPRTNAKAHGFHSRPKGANPTTITAIDGQRGTTATQTKQAGIYRLNNFDITEGGVTRRKAFSTMFPDACSQANVIAAIEYAVAHGKGSTRRKTGPSGPSCQASGNTPFDILIDLDSLGRVHAAYPSF